MRTFLVKRNTTLFKKVVKHLDARMKMPYTPHAVLATAAAPTVITVLWSYCGCTVPHKTYITYAQLQEDWKN